MEGNDSPWLKMRFLEMPEVKRHDDGGPTGNRRGKNVPVFLVVCHGHLQGFQFPTPRLAVGVEDQAQKLVYFAQRPVLRWALKTRRKSWSTSRVTSFWMASTVFFPGRSAAPPRPAASDRSRHWFRQTRD